MVGTTTAGKRILSFYYDRALLRCRDGYRYWLVAESDADFQLVARRPRGILVKSRPIPTRVADLGSHLDMEFIDEPEAHAHGGADEDPLVDGSGNRKLRGVEEEAERHWFLI